MDDNEPVPDDARHEEEAGEPPIEDTTDYSADDGRLTVQEGDPYRTAQLLLRAHEHFKEDKIVHRGGREQTFAWFGGAAFRDTSPADIHHHLLTVLAECMTMRLKPKKQWVDPDKPEFDRVPFKPKIRFAQEVAHAMAAQTKIMRPPPCWRGDAAGQPDPANLIVCKNAIIDVSNCSPKIVCPPTPDFFTINAMDYPYRPEATAPVEWLKFMDEIFPDDRESIETLQEIFGYCLTAWTSLQKSFMFIGPPRSGKGTILRVLSSLLGPANVASPTLSSLASSFGLEPLVGKLAATMSDARMSSKTDSAGVLETVLRISGEDYLSINRKHRAELPSERLYCRLFIAANELPRLADGSGALVSRFIILKMDKSFIGRENDALSENIIKNELPAIFNWAIAGRARLRELGKFRQPSVAGDLVKEFMDASSRISVFVDECCIIGEERSVSRKLVWKAWNAWCSEQGYQYKSDMQKLGSELRTILPKIGRRQPRNNGMRGDEYTGFELTMEAAQLASGSSNFII